MSTAGFVASLAAAALPLTGLVAAGGATVTNLGGVASLLGAGATMGGSAGGAVTGLQVAGLLPKAGLAFGALNSAT